MFWSGNYIAVREVGKLLTEKNVTLTQMLEADDILQECKADNKALICYLTKPQILAELITLILEEPPKDVELSTQYRHANIASEVLTSDLSMLSNQLAMDVVQMNRICDFVNRDPPLNPLLASYFSKTIGMLLDQSPKQDWCLYQIVCLRVLDIFRARRDFLPNLLRHMSTSAIADTFKYFIRLDFPFKEIIMEWFEEHQFLESLIQIICGTYDPPELQSQPAAPSQDPNQLEPPEEPEKAQKEYAEKLDNQKDVELQNRIDNRVGNAVNHLDSANGNDEPEAEPGALERWNQERAQREHQQLVQAAEEAKRAARRAARLRAVAADNAAELLCNLVANAAGLSCDFETMRSWNSSKRKAHAVVARLRSGGAVRSLLTGMFTATGARRRHALAAGSRVLLALLRYEAAPDQMTEAEWAEWAAATSVERAVAPHIPLLHHALLRDPALDCDEPPPPPRPPHPPHEPLNSQNSDRNMDESSGCQASSSSNGEASRSGCTAGAGGEAAGSSPRVCCVTQNAPEGPLSGCGAGGGCTSAARRVGAARLGAAALLAQLAASEVDDVPNALISLGTAGVLAELSFAHEHNNFLHAQLHALVRNALSNPRYAQRYADHLIHECNLLTQLMDLFEENEDKTTGRPRAGYMGHVVLMLRRFDELEALEALRMAPALRTRWDAFCERRLRPLLERHDTPLSGFYPSENLYEVENVADTMASNYDIGDSSGAEGDDLEGIGGVAALASGEGFEGLTTGEGVETLASGQGDEEGAEGPSAATDGPPLDYDLQFGNILDIARKYFQKVDELGYKGPWEPLEETPAAALPMDEPLPWESAVASGEAGGAACGGECWANFAESFGQSSFDQDGSYWPYGDFTNMSDTTSTSGAAGAAGAAGTSSAAEASAGGGATAGTLAADMQRMQLEDEDEASSELANNLRTAMSSMTPDVVANIVNANLALRAPLDDDAER